MDDDLNLLSSTGQWLIKRKKTCIRINLKSKKENRRQTEANTSSVVNLLLLMTLRAKIVRTEF